MNAENAENTRGKRGMRRGGSATPRKIQNSFLIITATDFARRMLPRLSAFSALKARPNTDAEESKRALDRNREPFSLQLVVRR
jgi:hypothetical protein